MDIEKLLLSKSGNGNGLWADLKEWSGKRKNKENSKRIDKVKLLLSASGNGLGLWAD